MKKSGRLGIRVDPKKKKEWESAAQASGLSLSAWMEAWLDLGSEHFKRSLRLKK